MLKSLNYIPDTDIMGQPLNVGDKVTIFNNYFISWEGTIVERDINAGDWDNDEVDMRKAIEIDGVMYFYGLGNHELIKEVN